MKKEYYDQLRNLLREMSEANAVYCRSIEEGHDDIDAWSLLENLKGLFISTVEDMLDEIDCEQAKENEE